MIFKDLKFIGNEIGVVEFSYICPTYFTCLSGFDISLQFDNTTFEDEFFLLSLKKKQKQKDWLSQQINFDKYPVL